VSIAHVEVEKVLLGCVTVSMFIVDLPLRKRSCDPLAFSVSPRLRETLLPEREQG